MTQESTGSVMLTIKVENKEDSLPLVENTEVLESKVTEDTNKDLLLDLTGREETS